MKLTDIIIEGIGKKINCNNCEWSWKESEGGKDKFLCHKCGHDNKPNSFDEFALLRGEGAAKIASTAKEKGGLSLLTYNHFKVKDSYYKKAAEGKFNQADTQIELKKYLDELCTVSSDMEQIHFQELVGLIEVLGELIIKSK